MSSCRRRRPRRHVVDDNVHENITIDVVVMMLSSCRRRCHLDVGVFATSMTLQRRPRQRRHRRRCNAVIVTALTPTTRRIDDVGKCKLCVGKKFTRLYYSELFSLLDSESDAQSWVRIGLLDIFYNYYYLATSISETTHKQFLFVLYCLYRYTDIFKNT